MFGTSNGVGHHFDEFVNAVIYERALMVGSLVSNPIIKLKLKSDFWEWWWLSQMFYLWASGVAKVSIAVALLRLTVRRVHRMILWGTITLTTIIGLVFWLVLLLDCHPIAYFWKQATHNSRGSCLPVHIVLDIAYLYSAITVVCDFTLGTLPIFLVWQLQMNHRTKMAVGGILSLGAM